MNFIYERCTFIFDPLHYYWEHERMHRKISVMLVLLFLSSLLAIELKRQGILPENMAGSIPNNHFFAIQAAFTVVLIMEIISLIFTIPCSFSKSVGKQFEILSLILLRNAFKELSYLPEPIIVDESTYQAVLRIVSDGFGALLIFALLGYYYRIQDRLKHDDLKGRPVDLYSFVAAKKGLALIILGIFLYMGGNTVYNWMTSTPQSDFFHDFYTLLIITDILLVLIAQCFQPSFYAVFRNSGYALSTLIIRLALSAPAYFNVLLGVAASLFAIAMTMISTRLFTSKEEKKGKYCH